MASLSPFELTALDWAPVLVAAVGASIVSVVRRPSRLTQFPIAIGAVLTLATAIQARLLGLGLRSAVDVLDYVLEWSAPFAAAVVLYVAERRGLEGLPKWRFFFIWVLAVSLVAEIPKMLVHWTS